MKATFRPAVSTRGVRLVETDDMNDEIDVAYRAKYH
jgi:hypothetical protein